MKTYASAGGLGSPQVGRPEEATPEKPLPRPKYPPADLLTVLTYEQKQVFGTFSPLALLRIDEMGMSCAKYCVLSRGNYCKYLQERKSELNSQDLYILEYHVRFPLFHDR